MLEVLLLSIVLKTGCVSLGTFEITAYHGAQFAHYKGIPYTASGKVAKPFRTIAVDPQVIPMGSRVHIKGLGWRVAEDTGGVIKGRIIDLYASSRHAALQWGRRKREVCIAVEDKT